jgi:hypothetical protein
MTCYDVSIAKKQAISDLSLSYGEVTARAQALTASNKAIQNNKKTLAVFK